MRRRADLQRERVRVESEGPGLVLRIDGAATAAETSVSKVLASRTAVRIAGFSPPYAMGCSGAYG
ncbi:conserved hypothetical protein [Streptomyces sviceus ATCC 29083]|uniref:Uncharacterized protein n=1 Tax=Streptomyces sviceus (strain ATCC 29083 / DSM 924 / JCM 4929 / NBRC 13980 / NCIMB 11184 / NRRL 5439 / UC 5370) TaxID=463191 RepID=B5I3I6_STRX2|nr:conserved hypothetical protein [Streptomyces sviceus ATCC 29083]